MRSGYVIFPQANVESEPSPLPDTERMQRELDLVDLAGELGFDEFWVTEHHFGDYNLAPSPLQLLSYVAGRFPARVGRHHGHRPPLERPAAGRRAGRGPRLPEPGPAPRRVRQGRRSARVQRVRHRPRRGAPALRREPRRRLARARDRRARARRRSARGGPAPAARLVRRPPLHGGRLACLARPGRGKRARPSPHRPALLGGGRRAGAAPSCDVRRGARPRAASDGHAHVRLRRPGRGPGSELGRQYARRTG